jgi:arylsulfatase A-like enzyme
VATLGSLFVRRSIPLAWSIGCFAALGVFSLLLPYQQLARTASGLIAIGVGVQTARLLGRNPDRTRRGLRFATVLLAGVVVVVGAGTRGWRALARRRALSSLTAAAPGAPNVLFIVLDTVRRANLHLYGYTRPTTPELERRAPEMVVFDHAIAPAPWTLPSHASLFTGRQPGSLGADWLIPLGPGARTLAEALSARGYVTGGFVANLLYTSRQSGLSRGFVEYDDYPMSLRLVIYHASLGRTWLFRSLTQAHSLRDLASALFHFDLRPGPVPANVERPADSVTDAFLAWRKRVDHRPYFAFLNYFDAHGPYRAPADYLARFSHNPRLIIDRYDAAIAWLDHEVGRTLDSLQASGELDRTLVVVLADHGDQFGEHNLKGHANSLYLPLLEVPLMIRYPAAAPGGIRVGATVTLADVAATVLDLVGENPPELPGNSLTRYWRTPQTAAPSLIMAEVSKGINLDSLFPNSHGPMRAILDDRLHYILDGRSREELYAWRIDSLEERNLAPDSALQSDMHRLRDRLDSARAGWAGPGRR